MPILPSWIIEKIKKEEEEKKKRQYEPLPLELPIPDPQQQPPPQKEPNQDQGDRGVVIIDPGRDKNEQSPDSADRGVWTYIF